MNVEDLKTSGRIIFETVSGSISYGTNTPQSDVDLRGFYVNPPNEYLGLHEPAAQISDKNNDTTYYSLKRAFELLMSANPNMIELLWMPQDCVRISSEAMERLIAHRNLFISKKCFHTHSGYAFAQIKKARGQNKKVHNPQPKEMPKKEDFCWIVRDFEGNLTQNILKDEDFEWDNVIFPCRPVSLKSTIWDLSEFHASSLEHSHNIFRLYYYGSESKGIFRGDDMLVCESIPKEEETRRFSGLLIYNQDEYNKALKEWHSYWDWMKTRNETRWIDQEKGKLTYDQKNMMHCMRLLISGEHILTQGSPIVRFEGDQLKYLMQIRSGELEYEDIMSEVERRMKELRRIYDESNVIPNEVKRKDIETLYRELSTRYE